MTEFNAYHQWLAIPPNEQPPDYYRLLGVSTFEADPREVKGVKVKGVKPL